EGLRSDPRRASGWRLRAQRCRVRRRAPRRHPAPRRHLAAGEPPRLGARHPRALGRQPYRQEVWPAEGWRHRSSRRSPRPNFHRRRQGPRRPRPRVQRVAEQEGARARLEDGAVVEGPIGQPRDPRQSRCGRGQDQGAAREAGSARLRQDGAGDRRRRAERLLRTRLVEPRQHQPAAGGRRQCVRHHAPRDAGSDPRRGRKAGGPVQWL
ncbi:MAG: LSU ribosomal protein L4p (L1e), partial [uncultured Sphingomonas sp.]